MFSSTAADDRLIPGAIRREIRALAVLEGSLRVADQTFVPARVVETARLPSLPPRQTGSSSSLLLHLPA